MLVTHRSGEPVNRLQSVATLQSIRDAQAEVRDVVFEESLVNYLLDIVEATRSHAEFEYGVSTRGALSFYRGCQARALSESRDFVIPDDIKALAVATLSHRVVHDSVFQGPSRHLVEKQIATILEQVAVPV